jgi:hypothetical protein
MNAATTNGYNYYYKPSTVVPLWGYLDIVKWKWQLLFFGVGEFLFLIPILVMWGIGVIPSVAAPWQYCSIYYIVIIPSFIVNISMSDSRSKELFLFAGIGAIFSFVVISFVFGMNLYDVIACWLGYLVTTCRDTMLADMIVSGITLILWIFTLIVMLAYLSIFGRIRQSQSVKGISIRNAE